MTDTLTPTQQPDVYPLLQTLYEKGGSDMFFSVGTPPQIKLEGHTVPLPVAPLQPG